MHRASVRAVGLELSAIKFSEQRMDFGWLEQAADADRAVTRELLQPILERSLAAAAKAGFVVAHAFDHIAEEFGAAFRAEHCGRALKQERRGSERLDLEAHRAQLAKRAM